MHNILITGGAGFIGSNLAKALLDKKSQVYIIDNFITGSRANIKKLQDKQNFHFIYGGITKKETLNALNIQFDIVYHLASPASPIQYAKYPKETLFVNSIGTQNVLEYIKRTNSGRMVFTSTSEVYGDPLQHPQKETYWGNVNSFGPRSCYDESKRFAEALCYTYIHKYGADIAIGRLFNTYGPNMEQNDGRVISNFIMQALSNNPITVYGDGTQTRSFCYVDDMVSALLKMGTESVSGEIINLGNPDEWKIIDIAQKIKQLTSSQSKIIFLDKPIDDPQRRRPSIQKAKTLLKWKPETSINSGFQKTIEYFQKRFLKNT